MMRIKYIRGIYGRHRPEGIFGPKVPFVLMTATLTTALTLTPMGGSVNAVAGDRSSRLSVGATVPLISEITQIFQIPILVISRTDVERGYVDIQAATRITLKNNNGSGYILLLEGLRWPFREVMIYGLAYDVQISTAEAFVYQPYSHNVVSAQLSYRFFLSEDADAGEYAWPLSLSIQPPL